MLMMDTRFGWNKLAGCKLSANLFDSDGPQKRKLLGLCDPMGDSVGVLPDKCYAAGDPQALGAFFSSGMESATLLRVGRTGRSGAGKHDYFVR